MSRRRANLSYISLSCAVACAALSLVNACSDEGGAGADSGGAAGTSAGSGGGGGRGGSSGGSGGSGGRAGSDAGKNPHPNSTPADIEAACKGLVTDCDSLPGKPLTITDCTSRITDACVSCVRDYAAGRADAGQSPCAPAGERPCSDPCSYLMLPPDNTEQCLEMQAASARPMPASYNQCLCTTCLDIFKRCKADDGCWEIVLCAVRTNCTGMACYTPTTCQAEIDRVGLNAPGTIISTELGDCTSRCPRQGPADAAAD